MAISTRQIVYTVVSLIIISALLPIGLGLTSAMGQVNVTINGVPTALSTLVDPTVLTLLTTLLPILVVVGIAMYYIPKAGD
ncbi:MAG: hypothetical protein WBH31_11730 [Promethearchaeia archaeon]